MFNLPDSTCLLAQALIRRYAPPSPDGGRGLPATWCGDRKFDIMKFTPSKTLKRARALRQSETEAERRLWVQLRDRRLNEFKFTRQVPIAPYIADFLCFEKKLIVEVDGVTHADASDVSYDERRTAFLEARGYSVMRVSNHDVYTQMNAVLDGILHALEKT
jgi:very-short-patch-repair endonuclease